MTLPRQPLQQPAAFSPHDYHHHHGPLVSIRRGPLATVPLPACAASHSSDPFLQDSYRLPEGMKRVGYDSDTGRYYFRGLDGSLWEGPEGAEFGQLRRGAFIPALHA